MTKELLWSTSGRFFGYRLGRNLWTHDGRHVGRFVGGLVYGPDGGHLGEVQGRSWLVRREDVPWVPEGARAFAPLADRPAVFHADDRDGLPLPSGSEDFPGPGEV